jgi:hypothetical protein
MLFAISMGFLTAIVILIVQARLDLRKFMGYPATMDCLVTLLIAWLLHGTFAGMTAAAFGGLFYSIIITIIRRTYGYKTLTFKGWVTHDAEPYSKAKNMCNLTTLFGDKLCSQTNSYLPLKLFIVGLCAVPFVI